LIPKSFQQPKQILGKSSVLKNLYTHAQSLLAIQKVMQSHFNTDISVAAYQKSTLHLIVPTSATATQLRYRQRNIIALVRRQCRIDVNAVQVSVRPLETPEKPIPEPRNPPSRDNARHMAEAAKYIGDEDIRKALIKLSKHGTPE
jgi:hypothetical protein